MHATFRIMHIFAIDPSLGRVDMHSLTDQMRMEILVEGMVEVDKIRLQDENGNFRDVCHWGRDIECIKKRVMRIYFSYRMFHAEQFPFAVIPPLVENFCVNGSNLHGTLDPSCLPANIIRFEASENRLHGSIDWKAFPRNLRNIDIRLNAFTGSVILGDLPDSIKIFIASVNKFTGEISMNELPTDMEYLELGSNKLEGSLDIQSLPPNMEGFNLANNCFSGEFRLMDLPPGLENLSIWANPQIQTAVLRSTEDKMHFELWADSVTEVLDEHGCTHAWEEEILRFNAERVEDEDLY